MDIHFFSLPYFTGLCSFHKCNLVGALCLLCMPAVEKAICGELWLTVQVRLLDCDPIARSYVVGIDFECRDTPSLAHSIERQ